MPPVAVVACTAKADADRSASGKRQSSNVNDGVLVHGPALKVAEIEAPSPNESSPLEFSLKSNWNACALKLFSPPECRSNDTRSSKPSGLISGSVVNEVRAHG